MFRAFLLLTLLSLPAPILAQTTQLVWLTNVTGSVAEGGSISFTVNRTDALNTSLAVTVDIVPDSPIEQFTVLSISEVTVTIPGGEVSASRSIGTYDNLIVNDDVEITVSIDASSSSAYHTNSLIDPWSVASTVTNGDDAYVLGVRLPDPEHVSDTLTEGETITLQFMRCVGTANTESVKSCDDAVTPRPGAKAPAALTQSITVEGRGNFF